MNIKKILLFFIFLGILSVSDRLVFSQGVTWDSPSTIFPESGNETKIFDEGMGPGDTEKRKSPLIFDGVGQAINFGVGQAISGGTSGNAQIMFGPNGIVISSLAGPVSLNTKGLVLKDYGVIPTAVTGGIALINNEFKFNTDGTIDGWNLPAGEGIWKKETKGGIAYTSTNIKKEGFWYEDDIKSSVLNGWLSFYEAWCTHLSCDVSDRDRECGDPVARTTYPNCGYDLFQRDGDQYLARYLVSSPPEPSIVAIGSDVKAKDIIVNGSVKLSGQLSFSPNTVFESKTIKVESNGSAVNTREIKNEITGKTDFSFCALGYQLYDKKFSNTYTGVSCSVYYDGTKKIWVLKAQRLRDDNAVECGAICF